MGDVVLLNTVTTLDIPVERVLDGAKKAELQDIIIIGYDKEGEFCFASDKSDGGNALWLLETAKKQLLETID